MGYVIFCGLDLILLSKGIYIDEELKNSILFFEGLVVKSNIINRERLYVKVVKEWVEG